MVKPMKTSETKRFIGLRRGIKISQNFYSPAYYSKF
jgi:hypothetical protein